MKEKWITALSKGEQGIMNFAFNYYRNNGGTFGPNEFVFNFHSLDIEALIKKFNSEFGVTTIYNKEGKFIKAI